MNTNLVRSSRLVVFCRKGVPRNFAKFTGKHLFQSLFFNKVFLQVFFCKFCRISENTFFYRTPPVAAFLLYELTKIHKCFEKLQPLRQIVSGLRCISASLSKYIDCFLKYQAKTWKSYIGA